MAIAEQVSNLAGKSSHFVGQYGSDVVSLMQDNSKLVLYWLPYLHRIKTGTADELLMGVASSLVEAVACAALGLVRPALLSLRTEVDLILTWLYFKDHKVEWDNLNSTGDGFKLKKELLEYFSRYFDGFGVRYGLLKQIALRRDSDTYRFLSAHIHAQSVTTLPIAVDLPDVVCGKKTCDELVEVANDVDEYINDVLMAIFARDWNHIPSELMQALDSRFQTPAQKKTFYETI